MADPIDDIQWVECESLDANIYNPNVVFTPELKLLEESIMRSGWIFPVIVNKNGIIIDGFHRWMLSKESAKLLKRYKGKLPVVTLDISDPEAMMMTVRMNRAKGTHVAVRMSGLVQQLVEEYGLTQEDLVKGMGMTKSEVNLLLDGSLLKTRDLKNYKYSKAWKPVETRHLTPEELESLSEPEAYERDESPED